MFYDQRQDIQWLTEDQGPRNERSTTSGEIDQISIYVLKYYIAVDKTN